MIKEPQYLDYDHAQKQSSYWEEKSEITCLISLELKKQHLCLIQRLNYALANMEPSAYYAMCGDWESNWTLSFILYTLPKPADRIANKKKICGVVSRLKTKTHSSVTQFFKGIPMLFSFCELYCFS